MEKDNFGPNAEYEGWTRWNSFEERGYTLVAYIPKNFKKQPWEFMVKVFKEDELVKEFTSPINHEPRWGVDVEDLAALEEMTEKILAELP